MGKTLFETLCGHGLFKGVAPQALRATLSNCRHLSVPKQTVLLAAGEINQELYVVTDGQLAVQMQALDGAPQYSVSVGACVGEMSLIDGQPASLTVVAHTDAHVLAIPVALFWDQVVLLPGVARNLLRQFSQRLRRQNTLSISALERSLRLKRIEQELAHARQIQLGLLNRQRPLLPEYPHVELAADIETARAVGGDLYDVMPIDENRFGIVVGDVSGKGMPAALLMVNTLTQLRLAFRRRSALQVIVSEVNQALCEGTDSGMFVSLFAGLMDQSNGHLTYLNAGHNPPVRITKQGGGLLPGAPNLLVGVDPQASFKTQRLNLRPGETLLLYTDGLTDTCNPQGEFWGSERLRSFAEGLWGCGPQQIIGTLQRQIMRFRGGATADDDITLLALRYLG